MKPGRESSKNGKNKQDRALSAAERFPDKANVLRNRKNEKKLIALTNRTINHQKSMTTL
jgi:hypothetical protein